MDCRMGQAIDDTGVDRISDGREDDRLSAADMLQRCHSMFDPHIAPNIPAQFLQAFGGTLQVDPDLPGCPQPSS
jgi:hypothetical protein